MRLNSDQLLSFVALAEKGGVNAAACARHLTQPAISNQLKRLQETIGIALYRRQGRGVVLTSSGELFYQYALRVRHALQEAEAFAAELQGVIAGRIHIAASQTLAGSLLPAALVAFRQINSEIEVFIDSGNSRQVFDSMESHDLGLVESPLPATPAPSCCKVTPLGQDEIVAVMQVGHPLAKYRSVPLAELMPHPLIWREAGSGTREALEQALLRECGHLPQVHLCFGGVAAVLEAARQGLGIGIISYLSLSESDPVLIARPLSPQLRRPMSLLLPSHAAPAAKKFADFLVQYLQLRLTADRR
ncbi:MAG: LysR family transcriptional regulator [Mariprofundales bacterium]|nr:LysR family transcriptional regulator [Mariprofundales bacterium]